MARNDKSYTRPLYYREIAREEKGPTKADMEYGKDKYYTPPHYYSEYTRIRFHPPLFLQRYERVYHALEKIIHESGAEDMSPKTVMDFACSTMGFHKYIRHASFSVKKLIYVDKDEEMLASVARDRLTPFSMEQCLRREGNLVVEVYAGGIEKFDPTVLNEGPPIYCITAIEIIEHLDPEILTGLERTVFGLIHPPVVIITTPNVEYNIVFGIKPGEFRVEDHRFEWTRAEFQEWCTKICNVYSAYTFTVQGIGETTTYHQPSLGHASQMAVFRRNGNMANWSDVTSLSEKFMDGTVPGSFKLIKRQDYGNGLKPATPEERIFRIFEIFIDQLDLATTELGFHMEFSKGKGKSKKKKAHVDIPFEKIFYPYGLPKGVYSFEEVGRVLEAGGYKIIKCGPSNDLGVRLPVDKQKITAPLRFIESWC